MVLSRCRIHSRSKSSAAAAPIGCEVTEVTFGGFFWGRSRWNGGKLRKFGPKYLGLVFLSSGLLVISKSRLCLKATHFRWARLCLGGGRPALLEISPAAESYRTELGPRPLVNQQTPNMSNLIFRSKTPHHKDQLPGIQEDLPTIFCVNVHCPQQQKK